MSPHTEIVWWMVDLWVAAPGGGSRCCQLCGEGLLVPSRVDPHVDYAVGDDEVGKEVGQEVVVRDKERKLLVPAEY